MSISEKELHYEIKKLKSELNIQVEKNTYLQEMLDQELKKNQMLLHAIPDMIFIIDTNGTYLDYYPGKNSEPYVPPSEFLGKTVNEIMPEQIAQQTMDHIRKTLSTNETQYWEFQLTMDDKLLYYEDRYVCLDHDKVLAIVRDISEHKKVEKEYKKLARAIEQSPSIVVITNSNAEIEYANPKFQEISNYTVDEVIGKNPRFLKSGYTSEEEYKHLWETIISGGVWRSLFKNKKKDVGYYWVNGNISAVKDSEGNITHYISVQEDVTEQKKGEKKLRESEERYHNLFEHANDSIFIIDPNTLKFLEVNENAAKRLGYSKEELLKLSVPDISLNNQKDKIKNNVKSLSKISKLLIENFHIRKDGSIIPVEISSRLIEDSGQKIIQGFVRDITDRKRAEENQNQLLLDLKRSNEELIHFVYLASHDLLEPLRIIASLADRVVYKNKNTLDDQDSDFLIRIVTVSKRLKELIKSLLEFSKVQSSPTSFVKVDLNKIMHDIKINNEIELKKKDAKLVFQELHTIDGNPDQIYQLLQNIIHNSLKFKKPNIPPEITIQSKEVSLKSKNNILKQYWEIHIIDNGIGFEQKYNTKVFEIFQRLHERQEHEGSGVGLAISKKIVEIHRGMITANSSIGKGATFIVHLPKNSDVK